MSAEINPLDGNPDFSNPDTIHNMLVFSLGLNEESHDPMQQVAVAGLRNVATDYISEDLTDKARAIRTIKDILPGNEKEATFETTTHSPEEIKAGLVRVLSDFSGERADYFRKSFGIPAPAEDNQAVKAEAVFKPEEEAVALGLIGLGFVAAKDAEKQHKVLTPDFIYAREPIDMLTKTLAQDGHIGGSSAEQLATVEGVKAKFLTELQSAIKANNLISQNHRRELARL